MPSTELDCYIVVTKTETEQVTASTTATTGAVTAATNDVAVPTEVKAETDCISSTNSPQETCHVRVSITSSTQNNNNKNGKKQSDDECYSTEDEDDSSRTGSSTKGTTKDRFRAWFNAVCRFNRDGQDGNQHHIPQAPIMFDFGMITGSLFLIWIVVGLVVSLLYKPKIDHENAKHLTPSENATVNTLVLVSSVISGVANFIILVMFIVMRKHRGLYFQMVASLSLCNFLMVISFIVLHIFPTSDWVCFFQAACTEYFIVCAVLWTFCIAFTIFEHTVRNRPIRNMQRISFIFHMICWGVPAVLAIIVLALKMPAHTIGWCWIGLDHAAWRFLFFYVLNFFSFFYILVLYLATTVFAIRSYFNVRMKLEADQKARSTRKKRILALSLRLTSFLIVFFITWIWGLSYRIVNLASPSHEVYALTALHGFFLPLQGFLNFLAYAFSYRDIIIDWAKRKLAEQRKKKTQAQKRKMMTQCKTKEKDMAAPVHRNRNNGSTMMDVPPPQAPDLSKV